MLKRKITNDLNKWFENKSKKALIIEGARQVGKTYIIRKFARDNYGENVIEINFNFDLSAHELFKHDLSFDSLHYQLSLIYRETFANGKPVLLFLDEIQSCPEAITALKSLTESDKIDVIASGSLLGIHYNLVSSFPVGYVERLTLYPLDFEEYLWALDYTENDITFLRNHFNNKIPLPSAIHDKFLKLFREYIVTGGMPEVLNDYISNYDFTEVLKIQLRILNDYKDDIAKYASTQEKIKAREIFESIPFQLGKDNKKFQYKYVSSGGRASKYDSSLQWLIDAGIIYRAHNISNPQIPFISYRLIDHFKIYMFDTGLLISMLGIDAQTQILLNNLGIAKGAIYENIIGVILKQTGHELYYYQKTSGLEIDFIISRNAKTYALEVKSSDNTKSKSLNSLLNSKDVDFGIKLSTKNISFQDNIIRIPLYLAFLL